MKNCEKIRNMSIAELAKVIRCPEVLSEASKINRCRDFFSCTPCKDRWLTEEEEGSK